MDSLTKSQWRGKGFHLDVIMMANIVFHVDLENNFVIKYASCRGVKLYVVSDIRMHVQLTIIKCWQIWCCMIVWLQTINVSLVRMKAEFP